ncbi:MAG: DUF2178 domain-containing protein [Syntrophomonadaceae bacterium]|nr:DUF2178 domain-containing protein [Syntrophomonadaceae bacterium]
MNTKKRFTIKVITLVILLALGIWAVYVGKTGLGFGLISASIAIFVVRLVKERKVQQLVAQGINPYDERAFYVSGKAAYAGYTFFVIITALVVLLGSIFGPEVTVNPYDFLGLVLAVAVFLYLGFYYYYNSKY